MLGLSTMEPLLSNTVVLSWLQHKLNYFLICQNFEKGAYKTEEFDIWSRYYSNDLLNVLE
jgi:hypothetical protein